MIRRTWTRELLVRAGEAFGLFGEYIDGGPYGTGHINDTFAVTYDQAGTRVRYVHQRVNSNVFRDPVALMENVARVCRHASESGRVEAPPGDRSRSVLTLVPAKQGESYWVDEVGDFWRTYLFIEHAATHDVIAAPVQAYQAARAFGRFQAMLADLPADHLHETIPDFHHTRKRLAALKRAAKADVCDRLAPARSELEFAGSRESLAGVLLELHEAGAIPTRVTHNDTKLNNVMLDETSGEAVCVIDLDTVMPGLSLYDFGDMVRTAVSPAAEDETDLSHVRVRPEYFEALARGFVETAGEFLCPAERKHLPTAGMLLTYENGLRFLTDYLCGDTYFKTSRPHHNLDRCRVQFELLRRLEEASDELHRIVDSIQA